MEYLGGDRALRGIAVSSLALLSFMIAGHPVAAHTCLIDGSHGAFSQMRPVGIYTRVQDALADLCDGRDPAGDRIILRCNSPQISDHEASPEPGCIYAPFRVVGRTDLLIRAEGPGFSSIEGYGVPAVEIVNSRQIVLEGGSLMLRSQEPALYIQASEVSVRGIPGCSRLRLSSPPNAAVMIVGGSSVKLDTVLLQDSQYGMLITADSLEPKVDGRELHFLDNRVGARVETGSIDCGEAPDGRPPHLRLTLGRNRQPNYVEGHDLGFVLVGSARAQIDHTILVGNLRRATGASVYALFLTHGSSYLAARQVLAYDNDNRPDAGREIRDWGSHAAANLARAQDCSTIEFFSSTLVHNKVDCALLPVSPSSRVDFWSSIGYQMGNKGACCSSGKIDSGGTSTISGSGLEDWDGNGCNGGRLAPGNLVYDPHLEAIDVPASAPWPAVRSDMYQVGSPRFDTGPKMADPMLFRDVPWSIDGREVESLGTPTDQGYHNPLREGQSFDSTGCHTFDLFWWS